MFFSFYGWEITEKLAPRTESGWKAHSVQKEDKPELHQTPNAPFLSL